jgi:hypothetical protein
VHEDTLGTIGMSVWLLGWAALWPLARFVLRRTPTVCRELFAIFIGAVLLDIASYIYIWDLRQSGNRDWFMALFFPQTIATVAWISSLLSFFRGRLRRREDA